MLIPIYYIKLLLHYIRVNEISRRNEFVTRSSAAAMIADRTAYSCRRLSEPLNHLNAGFYVNRAIKVKSDIFADLPRCHVTTSATVGWVISI